MARRSDNTREEIKKMAITAGLELLGVGGADEFGARKIATRIGYTVGTLYNVFEDFDDIILHINAATIADMRAALKQCSTGKKTPEKRLLDFAYCYGDYAMNNPARWNLLHNSARSGKLPDWYQAEIAQVFAMVEAPLALVCGKSSARSQNAAKVLWAGLHGICALSLSHKLEHVDAAPMRELITNFVQHYMRGLTAA